MRQLLYSRLRVRTLRTTDSAFLVVLRATIVVLLRCAGFHYTALCSYGCGAMQDCQGYQDYQN